MEYFDIMRGPWDRQEHHKPFALSDEKPPGAGYYPVHMEKERWNSYLEKHPDKRMEFEKESKKSFKLFEKESEKK